jgi:Fuc2NAc and GlcNAc transferase
MNLVVPIALTVTVFLSALWLTRRFLCYAVARQLLDAPNARSSHVVATPRGGGVAIVAATLASLPVSGWNGALAWPVVWGLLGGGVLVALIGFVDDLGHILLRRWRLLAHFAAAAWVLAWLGGLPPLPLLGSVRELGWMGHGLATLYLVWLLNLTNFMDGIDGIACVEAITVSMGGVLLCLVVVPGDTSWLAPLVLASATFGFLVWNWPPAMIFMGDAGSGFLGLMLAAFSLQAGWAAPNLSWSWVILLGVFVVDATVTLLRRMARGEKFYEAHRCHAYQHAARRWGAHLPVSLAVGAINVCWLLPMALLVALGLLDGLLGVAIAYAPLVGMAVLLGAGKPSPA